MADLATRYLGLDLSNPLVASAGPLTGRLDTLARLEAAGVAAVVLPSLFEEEIVAAAFASHALHSQGTDVFAEALTYLPELPPGPSDVERHLQLVADAKENLSIPVIASLNGASRRGWVGYATELVDAGADALELNVYFVVAQSHHTATDVEARHLDLVREVREAVRVPLAVKISPYFTATANVATALAGAGADGLVCFNRFYQPDIDLETLDVTPSLSLSTSGDLRLPLRWIALLHGHVPCSLAASSGVHCADDVVKAILAGADAVMSTSALIEHGPEHIGVLRHGLETWLDEHGYESAAQARGSVSARSVPDPDAYERANYVRVLRRFTQSYEPPA